jgi:predicted NAD/FAD-dependent oxidoreductase
MLRDAAAAAVGLAPETESLTAHRWRYARVRRAAASTACVTLAPGLFYASDGCIGDGVLAAVSSGVAAAEAILAAL